MSFVASLVRESSFCSIESFALVLRTPHFERTLPFYTAIFGELAGKRSTTSCLKMVPSTAQKCEVEWKGKFSESLIHALHLQQDPDGRTVHISSKESSEHDYFLPLPLRAAVVLRSGGINDTLPFYAQATSWQIEKHGNGPTHYSSSWGDTVVEIYPQRKAFPGVVELVLPVENLPATIERLKRQSFSFLHESATSALLHDPDNHVINFISYYTVT
jgi:lactoylglutathione lyase